MLDHGIGFIFFIPLLLQIPPDLQAPRPPQLHDGPMELSPGLLLVVDAPRIKPSQPCPWYCALRHRTTPCTLCEQAGHSWKQGRACCLYCYKLLEDCPGPPG